ncbi:MAG: hypothetical protein WCK10_00875 [Candidatus Staskawiczbacteria bacterium]
MRSVVNVFGLVFVLLLCMTCFTGCAIVSGGNGCISPYDDINEDGIGPISLGCADYQIESYCNGFSEIQPGGEGHILEIASHSGWIDIVCKYNSCCYIKVYSGFLNCSWLNSCLLRPEWMPYGWIPLNCGWKGQTERGIKIGSSCEEFRKKYPEAHFDILRGGYVVGRRIFRFGPFGLSSIQFGKK